MYWVIFAVPEAPSFLRVSSLGMTTTAEGVETPEQLAWLREEGCDEVQGYYLSRPVPAAAARDLLILSTLVPA